MLPQTKYIEYLLSTPGNYSGTHLAEHVPQVSPDQGNRFLRPRPRPANQQRASQLRALGRPLLTLSAGR